MNEVVEVIRGARELLSDPNKWCQNESDTGGQLCVMGAVCVAAGLHPWMHHDPFIPVVARVKELLGQHLPAGFDLAWEYNDDEDTTHQDILNLLDKTLADLGGLA